MAWQQSVDLKINVIPPHVKKATHFCSNNRIKTIMIIRHGGVCSILRRLTSPASTSYHARKYSSDVVQNQPPFRLAIIGSGPAGFYSAHKAMSLIPGLVVDMYEQLPVPFGLVRYGVAPDHPEVKVNPLKRLHIYTSCSHILSTRIARTNSPRSPLHLDSIL